MSVSSVEKNANWRKLAEKRANKVLNDYRLLANLKGSAYVSSMDERREVLAVIRAGLDELESHWSGEKLDKAKFKLQMKNG